MDIYDNKLFRDLEKLNFTVNESKTYLTLLNIGPSFAGNISVKAKLDRSSTYNALKMLIERGIVSTVIEGKKTIYSPTSPEKILDYYKEKEEIAKNIIPNLKEQYQKTKNNNSITLYRGFKGVKTIMNDIIDSLNEGDEYQVIGAEGQFSEKMPYFAPTFKKRKIDKKIKTKMLIRKGYQKNNKSINTNYRYILQDESSPATITIYNKKLAIFIWEETPEIILIENNKINKTFKNYFDFMWKNSDISNKNK